MKPGCALFAAALAGIYILLVAQTGSSSHRPEPAKTS